MLKLCDVTLRDGIQSFPKFISTPKKLHIFKNIVNSGANSIEIGSHVSNKITQMSDFQTMLKGIHLHKLQTNISYPNLIALIPTYKKYNEFLSFTGQENIDTVSLITAATNAFTYKNMNGMTIKKSLEEIDLIVENKNKKYRIYISCCFGCPFVDPFEDIDDVKKTIIDNTISIINRYGHNPNVSEIIISDTIGNYDELMLNNVLMSIDKYCFSKIGLHLHIDCENIFKVAVSALSKNIKSFDVSYSNLGGCTSIDSSKIKSNLNINEFIRLTRQIGFKDNINLEQIAKNNIIINKIINS